MPTIKSAIKRHRTSVNRNLRNRAHRSKMRTLVKMLRQAQTREDAAKILPQAVSIIDKNAGRGIIHNRTAARYKSRLYHLVASKGSTPQPQS